MRTYSLSLKIVAGVTLAFFAWSFLPLYSAVAYAVERKGKGTGADSRVKGSSGPARPKSTEEKFQESLDRIGASGGDRDKVRTERSEIEALDVELQKQFKETENKIKNLPETIRQRHRDFVKKYAANMSTLKGHLEGVERAKTETEGKIAAGRAREFLDQNKPKKTAQRLDPQNLPHQNRKLKGKGREPRTKEQFERDFPKQSKGKSKNATFPLQPEFLSAKLQTKQIVLAANEIVSDVPFALNVNSTTPQVAFADSTQLLLAQADLPSPEDLAENGIEIQFTDDIKAKAQELGYNPVKIYEYVRNNIEYAPTYGSIQGADMCLQSKICNDFDTASLL